MKLEQKLENEKRKVHYDRPPQARIQETGHRQYVGGANCELWYGMGKLQYHFLVSQGLLPSHKFLDVACGALRLGQFLIPYLNRGNYFGLEGESSLIEAGLKHELGFGLAETKSPSFATNFEFDFSFIETFDYAIAQSLFTHLTGDDIRLCFKNLRPKANNNSRFFFTFFEGRSEDNKFNVSHAGRGWRYSAEELESFSTPYGWRFKYIGDWMHPRGQRMAEVTPA